MQTEGFLAPETPGEVHETFASLAPVAREVTRAVARASSADTEGYRERVGDSVVETAHEALFGSLLIVWTADRETFEQWCDRPANAPLDVRVEGGDHVENIAWHVAPATDHVIAATYEDQREAAVSTVRRIAWGRIYRELITREDSANFEP